ncbi:MAG: DUF3891 family protein [Nonlabens sp.]
MIVNSTRDGYRIITHYAHGLQAAQIAQYIKKEYRSKYWLESLCAIIEHDDEQLNFERDNNVSQAGKPLDFTLIEPNPLDILERCKRVMLHARHRSGWVALMIAQHLEFLHLDLARDDKRLKNFFNELHDLKKDIRATYKINEPQSIEYYQLVKFCDRCSLIISMQQVPSRGRKVEINNSIDGQTYFMSSSNNAINVQPWIFEPDEFQITTEVYEVPNTTFANSSELQEYLLTHQPVLQTWQFHNTK